MLGDGRVGHRASLAHADPAASGGLDRSHRILLRVAEQDAIPIAVTCDPAGGVVGWVVGWGWAQRA